MLDNKFDLTVQAQLTQVLGQIHFVWKLTQLSDPGPSLPSCLLMLCKTSKLRGEHSMEIDYTYIKCCINAIINASIIVNQLYLFV